MLDNVNFFRKRKALKRYGRYYESQKEVIHEMISKYLKNRDKIGIWGAGIKGECFLLLFDEFVNKITAVYDIDKSRTNTRTCSGHIIYDYTMKENQKCSVIFLMNNVNETEVEALLENVEYKVILVNVDSVIEGELTADEAFDFYKRRF